MKKLLFVLVTGALLFNFAGCKENKPTPPPNFSPPPIIPEVTPVVPAKKIVVYDFWAPWCPPCRAFGPTFEAWKAKYTKENIEFKKVNVDEEQDLTAKFHVSGIPCIVIVVDGKEVKRWSGAPKESEVTPFLQ
jgi:thioredoxin